MLGYNYKTQFNFFSINPISASVLDLYQIQQILRNPIKSFNPTHGIGRIVYVEHVSWPHTGSNEHYSEYDKYWGECYFYLAIL